MATSVTAKLESPWGLRPALPRTVLERLMVRAHRVNYPTLAAWVQAVLEREGR